jgi:hypothetical protein
MKRIVLIDFENIQKVDLGLIDAAGTDIMVFVGRSQNKIPFSIVEKAQSMGDRIKWLKIAGDGKNNLDFHIAFELGRLFQRLEKDVQMIILSKDNGYDSLIGYINETGGQARRITNLAELGESKKPLPCSKYTDYITANLRKINLLKRPRTRSTLKKHIESLLRDKAGTGEIDLILEELFIKGLLTQTKSRLKYTFDPTEEEAGAAAQAPPAVSAPSC